MTLDDASTAETAEIAAAIRAALSKLAVRRPVFHSEADFQHELAVEIFHLDTSIQIRLERPVRLPGVRPINLDLLLRRGGVNFALELKYVTAKMEAVVNGEEFELKSQAAQDLRRYDIVKDIARIETLCGAGVVSGGMSITITNDRGFWMETRKAHSVDAMFRLHQDRVISGNLQWEAHVSSGTVRGREQVLNLSGTYAIDWVDYSEIEGAVRNGEFRILIAEITSRKDL